jgi:hypothetical protein
MILGSSRPTPAALPRGNRYYASARSDEADTDTDTDTDVDSAPRGKRMSFLLVSLIACEVEENPEDWECQQLPSSGEFCDRVDTCCNDEGTECEIRALTNDLEPRRWRCSGIDCEDAAELMADFCVNGVG